MASVGLAGWWWRGNWEAPVVDWVAGALAVVGGTVGLMGVAALGRNRTVFPEPLPHADLVQHGIYSHIRHPLYTSVMLLSVAWSLWRHSLMALGATLLLVGLLVLKARYEEDRLVAKFPDYARYRSRTSQFLPGIW